MKQGWTYKKLGEVCEIISGQSPEGKYYNTDGNGTPFYQGKKDFTLKYIGEPTMWTTNITKIAEKDDLLMSVRAPVGDVNFATQRSCIGRGLAAIRSKGNVDKNYLFYFLLAEKNDIKGKEGVGFASINRKEIMDINIKYPNSLSEQQRIVERLDSAFAHIDTLKANAEKQLREARALFQKALERAMEPKEGWEENTIGNIFQTYAGGTPLKSEKDYYDGGAIPWIRSGEVCQKYINDCELYITEKGMSNSSAKYYPINTILVAMYGATAAQVGILKFKATSNQAVCGILPHKDFVPEYIYYWFSNIQKDLASQAQGGAQPNLSQVKIKKVKISYPHLSEQQYIVKRLDSLSANLREFENIQRKIIAECDALKQALLRKVFE